MTKQSEAPETVTLYENEYEARRWWSRSRLSTTTGRTELYVRRSRYREARDETPAECIERNRKDVDSVLTLLVAEKRKTEELSSRLDSARRLLDTLETWEHPDDPDKSIIDSKGYHLIERGTAQRAESWKEPGLSTMASALAASETFAIAGPLS